MDIRKLSKKRKIYLGVFLALVAVLAWAFISAGIITHNFNRSQVQGKGDEQSIDVKGIILTETKDDVKYWEIYGETAVYGSNNKVALLNNVVGNFYKDNEVSMSFESSKGTYNEEKKQIILYANTKIVIKDGTTLHADRLVWSGSDKETIATGNVKITRNKDFVATADKAVISPDYNSFKIIGHTQSKLYDLKEKGNK